MSDTFSTVANEEFLEVRHVAQWRRVERHRLIASRLAVTVAEREEHATLVARDLDALDLWTESEIVGVYWPFRGEPDLRPWMTKLVESRVCTALPVVTKKGQPLEFREWTPASRLEKGVWNIPIPADGRIVVPTIVIAPLVGFDPAGYRLGYGGGFYDRTLASFATPPVAIGVGHSLTEIPTIHPQAHDIAMDWIVTGFAVPWRVTKAKAG